MGFRGESLPGHDEVKITGADPAPALCLSEFCFERCHTTVLSNQFETARRRVTIAKHHILPVMGRPDQARQMRRTREVERRGDRAPGDVRGKLKRCGIVGRTSRATLPHDKHETRNDQEKVLAGGRSIFGH